MTVQLRKAQCSTMYSMNATVSTSESENLNINLHLNCIYPINLSISKIHLYLDFIAPTPD